FTVQVSDGNGGTDTIVVGVTIAARNDAPDVSVNAGATVAEGGAVVLDATVLAAADVDDTGLELTYTITSAPANGQIERIATEGVAITSFTQSELTNSLVQYVHNDSETTSDSFGFELADGGE